MSPAQQLFALLEQAGLAAQWQVMDNRTAAPCIRITDPMHVARAMLLAYQQSLPAAYSFACTVGPDRTAFFYWPALSPDLSFLPGCELHVEDDDTVQPFAVWFEDTVIGSGATVEEAVANARREVESNPRVFGGLS